MYFLFDCRREAVQVSLAGVRVEICAFGWADAALPQAHGRQAVQVRRVRALVRALRPPGAAHEAPPAQGAQELAPFAHLAPVTTPHKSNYARRLRNRCIYCLFLSVKCHFNAPIAVNRITFLFIFDRMTFYIYNWFFGSTHAFFRFKEWEFYTRQNGGWFGLWKLIFLVASHNSCCWSHFWLQLKKCASCHIDCNYTKLKYSNHSSIFDLVNYNLFEITSLQFA